MFVRTPFVQMPGVRRSAALSFALLVSLTLLAPTARAQPLADRVPADAVIYVGWLGYDVRGPGFKGSHLEGVLDAGQFQKLVDDTLPKLLDKVGQKDRGAAEAIAIAKPILVPMLKYPTAVWIGKPELAKDQMPQVKAGLICQAGPDADGMRKHLTELLASAPDEVKQMVRVGAQQGDSVQVTVGYADGAAPVIDAAKSLTGTPGYKAVQAHVVKDASLLVYVDVAQLTAVADRGIDAFGDDEAKRMWPRVRDAIGFSSVKHFVLSSGFDGKDWSDHVFLHAPAPRTGLVALADPAPLSDDALKTIPATATMAGAAKFDVAKLVAGLRKAVGEIEPRAVGEIDKALADVSRQIGLDVQKDLLGAFGDEWVYYADPMTGGRGLGGMVMLNKLRDPRKAEETFVKLQTLLTDELAKNIKEKDVSVKFLTTKSGDTTIHYLGTPLVSPAWAVKNGYLVVGLFPQMVAGAADQFGSAKSILDNREYQLVRQRLGAERANGVSFADLRQTAPDAYATWVAVSRLTGFADLFGVPAPAMILPPLNKLMPHLGPAGSVQWTDNEGIHVNAISPFPGATIIATDPIGGVFGLAPVLGAMTQARVAAAEAHRQAAEAHSARDAAQPAARVRPEPAPK